MLIRVQDGAESLRLMHLASFMPVTIPFSAGVDRFGRPIRKPIFDSFVFWEVAALLAAIHFNERISTGIPNLHERLQNCDIRMTMELHDTQLSAIAASRALYPLLFDRPNTLDKPIPAALTGSVSSSVSKALGVLSGVYGIPFVSPSEAGSYFEVQHTNAPTFARTVPANSVYARAAVQLFSYWNASHAGLLYTQDEYGLSFLQVFSDTAAQYGIQITSGSYQQTCTECFVGINETLAKMKDLRYFVGIGFGNAVDAIMEGAINQGLSTDQHVWVIPQFGRALRPSFSVPRNQQPIADFLLNTVVVQQSFPRDAVFEQQMSEFKYNPTLQNYYVQSHVEPFIFDLYNWTEAIPSFGDIPYSSYDAVMALGIAACEIPKESFNGQELYQQLVQSTFFQGLTGNISFDSLTGTREFDGLQFSYNRIIIDEDRSDDEAIRFRSEVSMLLETDGSAQAIRMVNPFVFRSGSTTPPPDLAPVQVLDDGQVSLALRVFGWSLGGVAMLLAMSMGIWTFVHRNHKMIRLSQPLFLGMMCAGTFLMATSVLFLGWQEPWGGLDFACMATPWLLALGFSTAFSALFTKTWRINRLFQHAVELNRANLQAKDVLWPFFVMTATNVVLLTAWTLDSPLQWTRTDSNDNVDQFGRSVSSFGTCRGGRSLLWILLGAFNFVMVVFANYQNYVGRNVPSDFNESYYVTLSMASLLQCFLIGGPILFLVADNRAADIMVKAVLIAFGCAAILLPMFYCKFRALHRNVQRNEWGSYMTKQQHRQQSRSVSHSQAPLLLEGRRRSLSVCKSVANSEDESSSPPVGHDTVARIRASIALRERQGQRGLINLSLASSDDMSIDLPLPKQRHSLAVYRSSINSTETTTSSNKTKTHQQAKQGVLP